MESENCNRTASPPDLAHCGWVGGVASLVDQIHKVAWDGFHSDYCTIWGAKCQTLDFYSSAFDCLILQQGLKLNNERGTTAILLGDIGQEWDFFIVLNVTFLIRKRTSITKQSSQIHLQWIGNSTKPNLDGRVRRMREWTVHLRVL